MFVQERAMLEMMTDIAQLGKHGVTQGAKFRSPGFAQ
jgi:hypothetical protein